MKRGRSRYHLKNLVHQMFTILNGSTTITYFAWKQGVINSLLKVNFTTCATKANWKRSFSSRNTEEMESPPIKRDTRTKAISRVADSMADMAHTICQKRDVKPLTTKQEKQRNQTTKSMGKWYQKWLLVHQSQRKSSY